MGKKREKLDIGTVELMTEAKIAGVRLHGAMFQCTKCGALKPATDFGLRLMTDHIVRNQSQCVSCRSKSKKVNKDGKKIEQHDEGNQLDWGGFFGKCGRKKSIFSPADTSTNVRLVVVRGHI